MKKIWHEVVLGCVKLCDILLLTVPFAICWFGYYAGRIFEPFYFWGNVVNISLCLILCAVFSFVHNARLVSLHHVGKIVLTSSAHRAQLFHLPAQQVERYDPPPAYLLAKRVLDIVISAAAIVVLMPTMLITAIAVKAVDGGPVLYKQIRLTQNGKRFQILKFRSMRVDAEKDGIARLSTGDNDDRITPVGRVIRKFRIDELPQLFCILSGTMSLVGPRPERPEIAIQYEQKIPEFALRLQAKAGLTGYAQVYGKYNTAPYDKLQMDLMYIAHPSILEDLRILFATVRVLFMPESTEGVPEGQETALSNVD